MKKFALIAVAFLAACAPQAAPGTGPQAWQTLFDGQSLSGWDTRGAAVWRVENGYATTDAAGGDGFLVTRGEYGDFRLQVDFWADQTANGGIYFRVPEGTDGVQPSVEVNIMDTHASWPTGSINNVDKVENPQTAGRWVTFDITVRGNDVTVVMDGRQVAAGAFTDRAATGKIALQKLGNGVIRYRNVRVMPL